jgi:hypothetical protein
MARPININTGDRYGKLTVIQETTPYVSPSGAKHRRLELRCDCGRVAYVTLTLLRRGDTKSCGCNRGVTHGLTKSKMHYIWIGMRQRCFNPRSARYSYYGARGITVCDRWASFERFLQDMGEPPAGSTLDRIDNSGNYEPSNCRWATATEQQRNTRKVRLLTHNDRTQCLAAWADEAGISVSTLRHRLRTGWSIANALEKPLRQGVRPLDATE